MEGDRPYNPLPPDVGMLAVLQDDRLVLESIRTKFDALGVEQTAGTLILEQELTNATAETITFEVMKDTGNQFDTEIRLDRPDAFTITEVGFALGLKANAAVTATPKIGVDTIWAGPNPAAIALGLTAAMFDAIHSGRLYMKSDTVTYIETWDMRRCRHVGVSQEGLDPGGGTDYAADGWDGVKTSFARMVPSITLSGSMKLSLVLQLPRAVNVTVSGFKIHAQLRLRGFLSQGGAEFRTAKPNRRS